MSLFPSSCQVRARHVHFRAGRPAPARTTTHAFSAPQEGTSRTLQQIQRLRCPPCSDKLVILSKLISREHLSFEEAEQSLDLILHDGGAPEQIAAFLVLLAAKGETSNELAGLASSMRKKALTVDTPHSVVDIVGTGGDGIGSVNISTGACVLAAAAGAKVAKHGNRSVSSLCGSADVLEEFGVKLDLGPEGAAECLDKAGITFMFAPRFHPAMKQVVPVRRSLKVRTAFNVLGPMLNPAGAKYGLVGVYNTHLARLMAEALQVLGMQKALVVHSMGLDELTPMGPADVVEVTPTGITEYSLDPLDVGIKRCNVEDLAGGDAAMNAGILRDVFEGKKGAVADALILNAGYALAACEVATGPVEGIEMARKAQESGAAAETLNKWVQASQEAYAKESGGASAAA